jgi:hypothetical protein
MVTTKTNVTNLTEQVFISSHYRTEFYTTRRNHPGNEIKQFKFKQITN